MKPNVDLTENRDFADSPSSVMELTGITSADILTEIQRIGEDTYSFAEDDYQAICLRCGRPLNFNVEGHELCLQCEELMEEEFSDPKDIW